MEERKENGKNEWVEKIIAVTMNGKEAYGLVWALNKILDTPEAAKGSSIRKIVGRFITKLNREVKLSNETKG